MRGLSRHPLVFARPIGAEPERIEPVVRNDAHRLIEECMLLANVAVARKLKEAQWPAIHRIHEEPDEDQWAQMGAELQALGIPSEEEYVAAYCRRTGRAGIANWDYYMAYNMFRLAGICQGIMGRVVDLRISTLPTQYGEKVVIRLLEKSPTLVTLRDLGMLAESGMLSLAVRPVEWGVDRPVWTQAGLCSAFEDE